MQGGRRRIPTKSCLLTVVHFFLHGLQLGQGKGDTLALTPPFVDVAVSLLLNCLRKRKPQTGNLFTSNGTPTCPGKNEKNNCLSRRRLACGVRGGPLQRIPESHTDCFW